MPRKSAVNPLPPVIQASKDNLAAIRKMEKMVKEYSPVLAWTLTPVVELEKLGPEIWLDVFDAFVKFKKKETTIAAPGWDDVFKTGFDAPVSASEKEAYRKYKKEGGKNPLSSEQEETLARRKERAMRIAASPTPSSVRSIGTILTWYDDIQDSVVALSYVARVAAKITGKLSVSLAKKWAMPLAYAMTAADMIDWMRIFKAGDVIGDIARTRRLIDAEKAIIDPAGKAALAAAEEILIRAQRNGRVLGAQEIEDLRLLSASAKFPRIPALIEGIDALNKSMARKLALGGIIATRASRKRQVYAALESMPHLTAKQFKYLKKLRSILPSFAEAVQIAQTTAQTTGYGLSLGGVVGYASDEVFGALRGSKREPIPSLEELKKNLQEAQVHYPTEALPFGQPDSRFAEEAARAYQRLYKSPELTPLTMSALNIMNVGPALMSVAGDLSVEDNLFILTAVKRAASYLNTTRALDGWEQWSKPHLDMPITPPAVSFSNQFLINSINPKLVQVKYMLPFMDGVRSITPRLRTSLLAPAISNSFGKWLRPLGKDMRVNYAMGVIADLASDSFGALEGLDEEMTTRLVPTGRAVMALHEYGLASMLGTPPEIEMSLYATLTDMLIRRQGVSPTFQEVSALIDLFRRLY